MKDKFILVANWKMNPLTLGEAEALLHSLSNVVRDLSLVDFVVCPPALYLYSLVNKSEKYLNYKIGAQGGCEGDVGSATGQVSLAMIKGAGVDYVLLGHSEQRSRGETDENVNIKLKQMLASEMNPIVIIGEKERSKNKSFQAVLKKQLDAILQKVPKKEWANIIFAYEPVWAVGSKAQRECTAEECAEAVQYIREYLETSGPKGFGANAVILYGGSVDDKNLREYLDINQVNGFLLGRASLDPRVIGLILKITEEFANQKLLATRVDV